MGKNSDIDKAQFDIWTYTDDELPELALLMFENLGFLTHLGIGRDQMMSFIQNIEVNYNQNPFHNFRHVVDVTQFSYRLLQSGCLNQHFNILERFALLLASIGHDLGHPGTTNDYQRKYGTELFSTYGEHSPLERHHIQMLLNLITESRDTAFASFADEKIENLKSFVRSLIEATDIERHQFYVDSIKKEKNPPKELLGQIVLKCSDLCNIQRAQNIADKWAAALAEELCLQGDLERSKGVEVGFPLVRDNPINQPKAQTYFREKIGSPLFEQLYNVYPNLRQWLGGQN